MMMGIPRLQKSKSSSTVWVERANLVRHVINACKACTDTFLFWLFVAVCAIAEPFLCAGKPVGLIFKMQVLVLFISSVLYGEFPILLIANAATELGRKAGHH
jgi:hypothetical protein